MCMICETHGACHLSSDMSKFNVIVNIYFTEILMLLESDSVTFLFGGSFVLHSLYITSWECGSSFST